MRRVDGAKSATHGRARFRYEGQTCGGRYLVVIAEPLAVRRVESLTLAALVPSRSTRWSGLVRLGWDPAEVYLFRRLCRLVWSEWTHAIGESDSARKAEEGFLREIEATEGLSVKSIEEQGETDRQKIAKRTGPHRGGILPRGRSAKKARQARARRAERRRLRRGT